LHKIHHEARLRCASTAAVSTDSTTGGNAQGRTDLADRLDRAAISWIRGAVLDELTAFRKIHRLGLSEMLLATSSGANLQPQRLAHTQ